MQERLGWRCMLLPTTLTRYIVTQAGLATVLAGAGLLALIWLLQSLRFLDYLVNKGLGVGVFLEITTLLIPRLMVVIVPLACLAGAVFMCRKLQDDHETTALQASGIRPYVALVPLLGVAAVASAVLLVLMLWLLPLATTAFKDLQTDVRLRQGQLLLETGTFNPLGDNLMVYVKERLTPTSFAQLLVHDTRDPLQPVTWYARFGELSTNPATQAPELLLQEGLRQEAGPREVNMLEFASYNLSLAAQLSRGAMAERQPEVEERGLRAIWAEAQAAGTAPKRADQLEAEAVNRLSWPLLPWPLVMVAAGALLHPPKRKQSSLRGVLLAALAGVAVVGAQFGWLTQAKSGATWALWAMLGWPLICTLVATFWFKWAAKP